MLLFILVLIAFLIFYKLFKEFGKTQKIIINMSEGDREKLQNMIEGIIANSTTCHENPKLDEVSVALQEKFPDFTPTSFLAKAEEMFDAILNGFANSHHYILKTMLTEKLYERFSSQIERRETKNLRQEFLIKHRETTLDEIQILSEKAQIFVTFDVAQMSAMVTSDGISPDNPKRIYRDVIHKWVFERAFGKDNWILSKTSIGQASQEHCANCAVEEK